MPAFHNVLFPKLISYGSSGGPKFKTTVFSADSGYEQRNRDWQNVRCEYDVGQAIKSRAQMDELISFFYARNGRAFGFRFFDHADNRITQQVIGEGDGTTTSFQIVKTYTSMQTESGEEYTYSRPLTKIEWDSISGVTVDGVVRTSPTHYTVDYETGIITFVTPPFGPTLDSNLVVEEPGAEIKIGAGVFHVPCRFDTDHLDVTHEFWETMSWPNIPIIEVRDFSEAL